MDLTNKMSEIAEKIVPIYTMSLSTNPQKRDQFRNRTIFKKKAHHIAQSRNYEKNCRRAFLKSCRLAGEITGNCYRQLLLIELI